MQNPDPNDLKHIIRAETKQALTKTVWKNIRPVSLALSGLYLFFSINHFIWLPEDIQMLMVGIAGTTAIILFSLSIFIKRLSFSPKRTYPIGFFIILIITFNSMMHLYLTQEIFQTTNLILVIFGTGYFLLSRRWFLISLGLILVGWFLIIVNIPSSEGIVHYSIALFSTSLISTLFNFVRTNTLLELNQAKQQMEYMAKHDSLTELPNRWLFNEQIEHTLLLARRSSISFAILMIDLDNFKNINDHYGHLIGDQVIKKVGQRFQQVLRTSDLVSRWGGDEFAILLFDIENDDDIVLVINKVFSAFSDPIIIDSEKHHIFMSIGVAKYPQDGEDIITLLKRADSALYEAKEKRSEQSYSFFDKYIEP